VHATFDGGQTWNNLNGNGLTNLVINYIAVDPINRDTLYAATLGGSVFKTSVDALTVNINKSIPETEKIINFYPNPSTGIFTIKGNNIQSIEITNINGQTIKQLTINNERYMLDLSEQPKGIYFIKIKNDDFISVKKIVVQ
jgi:hypothetical protein